MSQGDRSRDSCAMQESEKQFERQAIRRFLDQAYIKIKDPSQILSLSAADAPLARSAAMEEAERILLDIRQTAIPFPSGELTWLEFSPAKDNPTIMAPGLYSGFAGLAVFFAAMEKRSKKEEIQRTAGTGICWNRQFHSVWNRIIHGTKKRTKPAVWRVF